MYRLLGICLLALVLVFALAPAGVAGHHGNSNGFHGSCGAYNGASYNASYVNFATFAPAIYVPPPVVVQQQAVAYSAPPPVIVQQQAATYSVPPPPVVVQQQATYQAPQTILVQQPPTVLVETYSTPFAFSNYSSGGCGFGYGHSVHGNFRGNFHGHR